MEAQGPTYKIKTRKFGGKLSDFKDSTERNFHKANYKAYLKGHSQFKFGKTENKKDKWYLTSVIWE